jgi:hypothetical protein
VTGPDRLALLGLWSLDARGGELDAHRLAGRELVNEEVAVRTVGLDALERGLDRAPRSRVLGPFGMLFVRRLFPAPGAENSRCRYRR